MKTGIELIIQERAEQITKHGRTVERDAVENKEGQLIDAAIALLNNAPPSMYPEHWNDDICIKLCNKEYKEKIVIAAALLAAEVDRMTLEEA